MTFKITELHLNFFADVTEIAWQNSNFYSLESAYVPSFALAGFIDFIVYPTFSLLTDMAEKIVIPLVEENPGPPDPCNRNRYTQRQGKQDSDTSWKRIQKCGYGTEW